MIKRFAILAAGLVALAPAAALAQNNQNSGTQSGGDADLVWRGELNGSCSISADREGTLALSSDNQYLQSVDVNQAQLSYNAVGPDNLTHTIKVTDSSVLLNNSEILGTDQNATVEVNYNQGSSSFQQVYQNNGDVYLDNQAGAIIDGTGTLNVDVRTTAHRPGNDVVWGTYVVSTTVACFVK